MASVFHWCEENAAATGSPAHGTTRHGFAADTSYPTDCSWKTIDDTTSDPSTHKINRPDCSYEKFQYGKWTGTFNQISNCKWTANAWKAKLADSDPYIRLMGHVSSTYTTPSRSVNAALDTDFTEQAWAHHGLPVLFSTTGPEDAAPVAILTAPGYSQYLVSQVQVAAGATYAGGNSNIIVVVLVWDEN